MVHLHDGALMGIIGSFDQVRKRENIFQKSTQSRKGLKMNSCAFVLIILCDSRDRTTYITSFTGDNLK